MPASSWTTTFLNEQRQIGDPYADATLAAIVQESGALGARELFDLLIRRIETPLTELPDIAATYLNATDRLPEGTDQHRIERAQALFLDHGPKMLLLLYFRSLPLLYSCAHGAQVLVQTSRLTRAEGDFRIFARRIAETAQFLLAVMQPDGLLPRAEGIQHIQKVRLVHASIRHFLRGGLWDDTAWGVPVNQEDMAITLLTFSITLIEGLEQFGITVPQQAIEDWQYTWNAVGRLLGLREPLLAADSVAARRLETQILAHQSAPSEAGQLLTQALLDFVNTHLPLQKFKLDAGDMLRFAIGPDRAADLGVTAASGCLGWVAPQILASLFRAGERLEDRAPEHRRSLFDELSRLSVRASVHIFDAYKQRSFSIPSSLQQAWQL